MSGTGVSNATWLIWGLAAVAAYATLRFPRAVGRIQRGASSRKDGGYVWLVVAFFVMLALTLSVTYAAMSGTFTQHELRDILLVVILVSLAMFGGTIFRAFRRQRQENPHAETYMWIEAWAIVMVTAWMWRSML